MFTTTINMKYKLLSLCLIITLNAFGQKRSFKSLHIGDPAPSLKASSWAQGAPIQDFKRGKVYVVDFWATWCRPCKAVMPFLSTLAHKYKRKVTFIAVDVWEDKQGTKTSRKGIEKFVDSMGKKMDFSVALDDSNFMAQDWLNASGEYSIPSDFIVNAKGNIAWIGNPIHLDTILPEVIDKSWDIKKVKLRRRKRQTLYRLANKITDSLQDLRISKDFKGKRVLDFINNRIKETPNVKFTPMIARYIFDNLLLTSPHKAYEFGMTIFDSIPSYLSPPFYVIYLGIEHNANEIDLPEYIYQLGAEAYQKMINNTHPIYRQLLDTSEIYRKMSAWYLLAGDTLQAEKAKQKSYNTTVIVKKEQVKRDTISSPLTLWNPYYLKSDVVWPAKKTNLSHKLLQTYNIYLPHPTIFEIGGGHACWFIKPGDSILLLEKDNLTDSNHLFNVQESSGLRLPIISTDTLLRKSFPKLFYSYYVKDNKQTIETINVWLGEAFNTDKIEKAAKTATKEYFKNHPVYSSSDFEKKYLMSWYEVMILLSHEKVLHSLKDKLEQNPILSGKVAHHIIRLAAYLDHHVSLRIINFWNVKPVNYWKAIKSMNKNILSNRVEKQQYNIDSIERTLSSFDDTTGQYILLGILQDNQGELSHDNLAQMALASRIKLNLFYPYIKKYIGKKMNIGKGYLNITLRSALLYNTNMEVLNLDSVFRSSRLPYLYVNFCGTWSSSSISNMKTYAKNQEFTHQKIRPVWIFFENNKTDWLKIIKKYHLPEQDCFMVKDSRKMEGNFSNEFGWQKNFPHYFLFNREGKCLNNDAPPFSDFDKKAFLENEQK